jgi:hypothetical protein
MEILPVLLLSTALCSVDTVTQQLAEIDSRNKYDPNLNIYSEDSVDISYIPNNRISQALLEPDNRSSEPSEIPFEERIDSSNSKVVKDLKTDFDEYNKFFEQIIHRCDFLINESIDEPDLAMISQDQISSQKIQKEDTGESKQTRDYALLSTMDILNAKNEKVLFDLNFIKSNAMRVPSSFKQNSLNIQKLENKQNTKPKKQFNKTERISKIRNSKPQNFSKAATTIPKKSAEKNPMFQKKNSNRYIKRSVTLVGEPAISGQDIQKNFNNSSEQSNNESDESKDSFCQHQSW